MRVGFGICKDCGDAGRLKYGARSRHLRCEMFFCMAACAMDDPMSVPWAVLAVAVYYHAECAHHGG